MFMSMFPGLLQRNQGIMSLGLVSLTYGRGHLLSKPLLSPSIFLPLVVNLSFQVAPSDQYLNFLNLPSPPLLKPSLHATLSMKLVLSFFFSFLTQLFETNHSASFHFFFKNCKQTDILSCLQMNKSVCHSFMRAGRRTGHPGQRQRTL